MRTYAVSALAVILVAAVVIVLLPPWKGSVAQQQRNATATREYYTCPMHPSVISDRPGACPVCGMALVKKVITEERRMDSVDSRQVRISPAERVLAHVATSVALRRRLTPSIAAAGIVTFVEPLQTTVSAHFRGRIEKLYAGSTGVVVQKGEPLFDLYSPDLISAEREFVLALQAGGDGTGRELLEASRERLTVRFGLTRQQVTDLERTHTTHVRITYCSPMTGTVIRKDVQEGQYVDEGMVLYQLADLSRVWVVAETYEKDIRFVHIGAPVSVRVDAYPGKTFSGRVQFIEPVLNADTRTVRVRIVLANPSGILKPNMFAKVALESPIERALVVPRSAVLFTGRRPVVWVEVGVDQFEARAITVGASTDAEVEILDGLEEGQTIAASGGYLIDSESALNTPGGGEPAEGKMDHSRHVEETSVERTQVVH